LSADAPALPARRLDAAGRPHVDLRAILRLLGEMSQALQAGTPCRSMADLISGSLTTFLRRGETEIYPLYNLVGSGVLAPRVA